MSLYVEQMKKNAEQYPNKIAIVDMEGTRATTYEELDILSDSIAAHIANRGNERGSFLPVLMPRQMEFLAAAIGILKAGCIFVPLTSSYPEDRIADIISQCGGKQPIDENFVKEAVSKNADFCAVDIGPQDGAFAVYTSGSTGRPKGIVHNHYSLYSGAYRLCKAISMTERDTYLSSAPFHFVAIVIDAFSALLAGATLHINSDTGRKDIHRIESYIKEKQITGTFISPQMLKLFSCKNSHLRFLLTGSERVSGVQGEGYDLYNLYGSSETTPAALYFKVDRAYENTPIGKAFDEMKVFLLREDGTSAEPGETGEICISGPVAEGYLNLPEKTQEVFTENPFAEGEHDKILYHSGDLGKIQDDGNIVYVNRKDWMVKINGQRVETAEIEALINRQPFVKTAVVKGFENQYGQTYLCSYFQLEEDAHPENPQKDIREALRKNLPDYMIPQFFLQVENFALNQNGKLDRMVLEAPNAESFQATYEKPETEAEQLICQGFEAVLGLSSVGRKDDFFVLGGDSIKVVRLQEHCAEIGLTSQQIFSGRTPEEIGKLCGQERDDLYQDCHVETDFYPLTDSQIGVFLECLEQPDSVMYNIPFQVTVPSSIDCTKLQQALEQTIGQYPVLNVAISQRDGVYGMVPGMNANDSVPVYQQQEEDMEHVKASFIRPFDIEKGPLFRIELHQTPEKIYLMADFHHIISDGASVSEFFEQVAKAYKGSPLEAELLSQFDLSIYEQSLKEQSIYHEAQEYFENRLAGNEIDSNLPFDYSGDSNEQSYPAKRHHCNLNERISAQKLEQFTRAAGITENTFFLGAFAYALGKFTGQTESLFSAVNNGRHDPRFRHTLGMLVRTLPIYVNMDEEEQISSFLQKMQQDFFETMSHDCCSFAELANKYGVNSEILFVYQAETLNSMELEGLEAPMEPLETGSGLANLALHIFKKQGGYHMFFEYRSDLYAQSTLESFSSMMMQIMEEFIECSVLKEISLVSEDAVQTLNTFHGQDVPYDESLTVVDLFRRQVQRVPDHTAVIYKENRYTYSQVDDISERIAGHVVDLGIGTEQVVSILLPRCEYMPIASIGVLKAGGAYQPLDPTYPMERLAFMMEDAKVGLLIADEQLLHLVPDYKGPVLLTKDIPGLKMPETVISKPSPKDLFILLYTSGTTGTPKGCMITHGNLTAFCNWYRHSYQLEDNSVVAAYASYGFDANMMDMYPALTSGSTVCIIPEELRLELNALNQYFIEEQVSHAFMTTQVGRQFAAEIENHSLKYLSTGGETLVPVQSNSDFTFFNLYGPTECTILTTAFVVDKTKVYDNVPIGRPMDNMELYVTDKYERRLPIGALGELCVAGHQVSRGYLGRPEQTEKVYTPNPFTQRKGFERIYHTGDVVRFLSDGNLQFVGRRDGQVKIRGFRIELTEVEGIVRKYPAVKDATVMAFDAPAGGKAIAAYIVSDEKVDIEQLNDFIREEKPPYMVPAVTLQIDQIPLNQNMKVNKRALPDPLAQIEGAVGSEDRPMTLLEKELTEIVGAVVGHKEFSVNSTLANVGITSLSAIKLAAEIHKEYGITLEVKEMMKQCSILSIEDSIYAELRHGKQLIKQESDSKELREAYPLTQTQLGVFYDTVKSPESLAYHIPAAFDFPKETTTAVLKEAVEKVIQAHTYLNVRLAYEGKELVQCPTEKQDEIPVLSMTEEQVAEYKGDFVQSFELIGGQLYRMAIIETPENLYLLADFHHIIFDGGSMSLLFNQIAQACEGVEPEKETYTYLDFVTDEEAGRSENAYEKAGQYFAKQLENCEGASVITPDLSGKEKDGAKAEEVALCDGKAVEGFCREKGMSPAHLFLAAVFYTLSRYTGSGELYISTISSGRSQLAMQNSVGMFVKTLALAANTQGDKTALQFIEEAKTVLLETVANEIYPFTEIAAKYNYVPEIMYACQLGVMESVKVKGQEVHIENLESDKPKFKISIHIEERLGQPAVCIQYNDQLYSSKLMNRLAQSISLCAKTMMEDAEKKLNSITLLTEEDQDRVLKFSQTGKAEPEDLLFHKAFEKQVLLHKDKTALVASEGTYTYEELNDQMNRIGSALADRGFGVGQSAVVLLPRTGALIMAMYGVMKAGGAYIPCDPEYPAERIRQITEDSNATVIITTKDKLSQFDGAIDIESLLEYDGQNMAEVEVKPDDLAYMIYTSGSTGKPKGVMLEHRGITNYIRNHQANCHVQACAEEGSVMVSVTTVSFDMSLKETAVALCNGLTLVLADEDTANHPVHLAELMEKTGGDIFNATPSRLLQYMESKEFCKAISNCKIVMSGGEQYTMKLLNKLKQTTEARIFNTYGPTEITVSSNAKELTNAEEITIGKPLLNYIEYVVDSHGNLLPPGVVGELYIGGIGVARGYHGLEQQTAERFITYNGQRMYRSGDYARWNDDGDVVILGRTDNQIKLRGLRIELEEIETAISAYPGIKATVVVIKKIQGTDHLCAYFTADETVTVESLKTFLKARLTGYMIPTGYCKMDVMPMTPNGKIDRKQLPEPELTAQGDYVAPANDAEEQFCKIFAQVLELDQVGACDDFFDLGGSSLIVTRVIITATDAGFDITYGDVFSHSTPRALAAMFQTENADAQSELEDLSRFDYSAIADVLAGNTMEAFSSGEEQPLGNILLTGATGFLGIHILREFLENEKGSVYCILRKGGYDSVEERLTGMLFYYFENSYEELLGTRIFITEGDVTQQAAFDSLKAADINTVINCAANVKHFSSGTDIEDVNVGGVCHGIDYCKETGSRLVHISTTSVSGFSVGEVPPSDTVMTEQMLYFNQALDTKYGHSKFLAERAILQAIAKDGLKAKIMRVGNLSARDTDGEFQMNFGTNSFVGRLKSYKVIGKFPYTLMDSTAEMAPIDSTATAILLLAKTPDKCCVFHPYNNHSIYMGDIISGMKVSGIEIDLAEEKDYLAALEEAQKDPEKATVLSSMIAYQNMGHGKKTVPLAKTNDYTMQVLYRMQYCWPVTGKEYVSKLVEALDGLGYF